MAGNRRSNAACLGCGWRLPGELPLCHGQTGAGQPGEASQDHHAEHPSRTSPKPERERPPGSCAQANADALQLYHLQEGTRVKGPSRDDILGRSAINHNDIAGLETTCSFSRPNAAGQQRVAFSEWLTVGLCRRSSGPAIPLAAVEKPLSSAES